MAVITKWCPFRTRLVAVGAKCTQAECSCEAAQKPVPDPKLDPMSVRTNVCQYCGADGREQHKPGCILVRAIADAKGQKNEPALRFDAGKSRVDLIPPEFIEALGRHYGEGAKKYAERNWEKGMSYSRCYASAQRHMLAFWRGEENDEETGAPHTICAAWNMAALHWYGLHGVGTDDRVKS